MSLRYEIGVVGKSRVSGASSVKVPEALIIFKSFGGLGVHVDGQALM